MMQITISPSRRKGKKFRAVVNNEETIHFGAQSSSDFTLHQNEERKQRYI